MAFVDEVTVFARGGRGGNGSASILREPYNPRGGPDGGDGGAGGDVVFEVSTGARDLAWLADHPHVRAPNGGPGGKRGRTGSSGEDLVIRVPDGTRVEDQDGLLADLVGEGARAIVARGGRGGRGNASMATQRERVPRSAEAGETGEERRLSVELRTVADLGLVGLPNAGKSTLLAHLTAAHPKIADYPFTTLVPNLGTVGLSGERSFVVADIPGLIEGAHAGAGLGDRFLRHLDRTRLLVHLLDASAEGRTPLRDYEAMNRELALYDPELAARPQLVVLNKIDLPEVRKRAKQIAGPFARRGIKLAAISAATGEGTAELLESIWRALPPRSGST
jgi:GTPase